MQRKSLREILTKIRRIQFKENFDLVVGIGEGGIAPAQFLADHLSLPLETIWINYRDKNNNPKRKTPKLLQPIRFDCKDKAILLVDDRSNTGATIRRAKSALQNASIIKTFVVNGKADYSLFEKSCFAMPWDAKVI